MKIAVTGPESCLGSRLIEALHLGDGASVAAVPASESPTTLTARFSIDLRPADPCGAESLRKAFERCSSAIHTGGTTALDAKRSAIAFARAAAGARVRRAIYVSSPPVPASDSREPGAAAAMTDYPSGERSQAAAERQFLSECRRGGVNAFVIRTGIVYGPRSPLIAEVAMELRESRAWLPRHGADAFSGVYVDNVVAAIRLCLKTKAVLTEPVVVADAETATWRDVYHLIAQDLDLSGSRIRSTPSGAAVGQDEARSAASNAQVAHLVALQQRAPKLESNAAAKALGYHAAVAFSDGIRRSCQWWRFVQGEFEPAA